MLDARQQFQVLQKCSGRKVCLFQCRYADVPQIEYKNQFLMSSMQNRNDMQNFFIDLQHLQFLQY